MTVLDPFQGAQSFATGFGAKRRHPGTGWALAEEPDGKLFDQRRRIAQ